MRGNSQVRFLGGRSGSNALLLPDKAGQTLYGDEVGGAIVPEDEGDLLLKLAREALSKADIPDLQSLFAENCHVERPAISITEIETDGVGVELAPADIPTAPTKTTTFDAWMDGRGTDILISSRKKKAMEGQMSLFDLVN